MKPGMIRASVPLDPFLTRHPVTKILLSGALGAMLLFGPWGCGKDSNPGGPAPTPETGPPPFRAAATCGGCHPHHLQEWESSMHAFGSVDPLMLAMSQLALQEAGPVAGSSCRNCHSPSLVRQETWLAAGNVFSAEHPDENVDEDGVSCDVCHSIQIVPPVGNIDFLRDVDPRDPKLGSIADPVPTSFHESLQDDSFRTSIQCAPCHQLATPAGVGLENTFVEWQQSIHSGQGVECQNCHMPAYQGQASSDGPVRTVHHHGFVGPDYAYEPFRGVDLVAQKAAIADLMKTAVLVSLSVPPTLPPAATLTVQMDATNAFTGHAVPSGVSFAREMWVELVVKDAAAREILVSGRLDANGDLPSDADLVKFGAVMRDAAGAPTFFTWRAVSIDETGLLQPGETRHASWTVPIPGGTAGPLTVEARLRFRPVSPAMVRMLGLDRLLPIEIFDMWSGSTTVSLE